MSTNILPSTKFSLWLRNLREQKGMSQRDVERNSNGEITKGYIGFLENEDKFPGDMTLKKLIALSIGLQVSIRELIEKALESELERFNTVKMSAFEDFDEVTKEYVKELESDRKRKSA
jgi:transcriptional regulator with XRE-family HTH domain